MSGASPAGDDWHIRRRDWAITIWIPGVLNFEVAPTPFLRASHPPYTLRMRTDLVRVPAHYPECP